MCNGGLKFISFKIIAAISWPPPMISQLFHPGFLRPHHSFTAWLFCVNYIMGNGLPCLVFYSSTTVLQLVAARSLTCVVTE